MRGQTFPAADQRRSTPINLFRPIRVHSCSFVAILWFAVFLFAALACAEIIDRIVVTVDNQVITTSEISEALRVAAFLNGEKLDFSGAARRQMADRLIEQVLVRRGMELPPYPEPPSTELEQTLSQVKPRFPGDTQFQQALAEYKLTQRQIENSLRRQITLLHFTDLRFRPEVQVQESDVKQYYETVYLPDLRKKGVTPEPSFEDAQDDCEEALTTQLVDKRVDAWLAEARGRARIEYDEDAFR